MKSLDSSSVVTLDLEKQGTRLLIATERLDHQNLNHLIRIWGNPQPVLNDLIRFLNQP